LKTKWKVALGVTAIAVTAGAVLGGIQYSKRGIVIVQTGRAARQDLIRMATELREELESDGLRIRGGLYVSCVARGQALFGDAGHEMALLQANLGEFPLAGFYANGEIARDTLYGHTGVLTLFV